MQFALSHFGWRCFYTLSHTPVSTLSATAPWHTMWTVASEAIWKLQIDNSNHLEWISEEKTNEISVNLNMRRNPAIWSNYYKLVFNPLFQLFWRFWAKNFVLVRVQLLFVQSSILLIFLTWNNERWSHGSEHSGHTEFYNVVHTQLATRTVAHNFISISMQCHQTILRIPK